jgi:hypothetical protein
MSLEFSKFAHLWNHYRKESRRNKAACERVRVAKEYEGAVRLSLAEFINN